MVSLAQIFFQEGDFPSTGSIAPIRVVKNGANAEPITVTIIPMTVSEYLQSGRSDCPLQGNENAAESKLK